MSESSGEWPQVWDGEFRFTVAGYIALTCALFDAFPVLLPRLVEHVQEYEGEILSTVVLTELAQAMAVGAPDVVGVMGPVLEWLSERVVLGDPVEVECVAVGFVEGLPLASEPDGQMRGLLPPVLAELQ